MLNSIFSKKCFLANFLRLLTLFLSRLYFSQDDGVHLCSAVFLCLSRYLINLLNSESNQGLSLGRTVIIFYGIHSDIRLNKVLVNCSHASSTERILIKLQFSEDIRSLSFSKSPLLYNQIFFVIHD